MNVDLPFPRGSTYFDGSPDLAARSSYEDVKYLLGRTFTVQSRHNQSENELMIVRNTEIQVAAPGPARGCQTFNSPDGGVPYDIADGSDAAQKGWVFDDEFLYTTEAGASYSAPIGDLFYVVIRGPVFIIDSPGGTYLNDTPVKFDAFGFFNVNPSGTDHCIGRVCGTQTVDPQGLILTNVGHPWAIGPSDT